MTATTEAITGQVVLVGGGTKDPGLMTVSGRKALFVADVVVTDRMGPVAVLDDLGPDVEVIDVGKILRTGDPVGGDQPDPRRPGTARPDSRTPQGRRQLPVRP